MRLIEILPLDFRVFPLKMTCDLDVSPMMADPLFPSGTDLESDLTEVTRGFGSQLYYHLTLGKLLNSSESHFLWTNWKSDVSPAVKHITKTSFLPFLQNDMLLHSRVFRQGERHSGTFWAHLKEKDEIKDST